MKKERRRHPPFGATKAQGKQHQRVRDKKNLKALWENNTLLREECSVLRGQLADLQKKHRERTLSDVEVVALAAVVHAEVLEKLGVSSSAAYVPAERLRVELKRRGVV